ncbi:MAG: DUF3299 domain-containing protein [Burkholderiales bacterium]|nr:DUF3299 domain-containing protein [Burkholderiales bacterium]
MTARTFSAMALLLAMAVPAAAQTGGTAGYAVGEPIAPERKEAPKLKPPPAGVRDLDWDDMVPKDWNPRAAIDKLGLDRLEDGDPRATLMLEKIRADWDRAPVVKALDGVKVRLPGFVVMLEGDAKGVSEFLLVPYFGACIHVPPPPSNQVVHVLPAKRVPEKLASYPVWVTGTMRAVQSATAMASAGYRIEAAQVEEYPWRR